jgi:transcriptional regulator with XRE-family HTH domain
MYLLPENYIIDRIEQLCESKKMSRYRLAQKSGISQSSISTLLNRKSVPTIQTLEKICDGFGITLAQFFIEDDKKIDLTSEQQKVLKTWDGLTDSEKELVQAYVQGIKSR